MVNSSLSDALTLRLHVWFERDSQIFIGMGRALLLQKIEQYGSLRQAASDMKISYRAAWGKLKASEECIGKPLVQKVPGSGQRYELTALGKQLCVQFLQLQQDIEHFARDRAAQLFDNDIKVYAEAYPESGTSDQKA